MKLFFALFASAASLVLAAPASTIQRREDYCGQWDKIVTGPYTIYNNLWGQADATSGKQCTGVDGFLNVGTITWHTSWTWAGGQGHVKSYANVVTNVTQQALSSIKTLPSTYTWSYSGESLVANVAYDLFTSSTASGSAEYEVMIWLGAFGGAGPISATGNPIAAITLAGTQWSLYNGKNGQMNVFSFVRVGDDVKSFSGDLNVFLTYLTSKQGVPKTQILTSVGAGTEPFTGSNAKLTVSAFSLSET